MSVVRSKRVLGVSVQAELSQKLKDTAQLGNFYQDVFDRLRLNVKNRHVLIEVHYKKNIKHVSYITTRQHFLWCGEESYCYRVCLLWGGGGGRWGWEVGG